MSQDQPLPPLTQERLQEIRDADAGIALDSLRWFTPIYTERRQLLLLIDEMLQVKSDDAIAAAALSDMLEPYSGGTRSLPDLVARLHHAREIRAELLRTFPLVPPSAEALADAAADEGGI